MLARGLHSASRGLTHRPAYIFTIRQSPPTRPSGPKRSWNNFSWRKKSTRIACFSSTIFSGRIPFAQSVPTRHAGKERPTRVVACWGGGWCWRGRRSDRARRRLRTREAGGYLPARSGWAGAAGVAVARHRRRTSGTSSGRWPPRRPAWASRWWSPTGTPRRPTAAGRTCSRRWTSLAGLPAPTGRAGDRRRRRVRARRVVAGRPDGRVAGAQPGDRRRLASPPRSSAWRPGSTARR